MLPKIIVAGTYERETLLSSLGLSIVSTMGYEGGEGKIDDLRRFINFGRNVSTGSVGMSLVIWDADKLSPECQAVLLKPLEESSESMCLFLVAGNENGLLPTILSRCVIVNQMKKKERGSLLEKYSGVFCQGSCKVFSFCGRDGERGGRKLFGRSDSKT